MKTLEEKLIDAVAFGRLKQVKEIISNNTTSFWKRFMFLFKGI